MLKDPSRMPQDKAMTVLVSSLLRCVVFVVWNEDVVDTSSSLLLYYELLWPTLPSIYTEANQTMAIFKSFSDFLQIYGNI